MSLLCMPIGIALVYCAWKLFTSVQKRKFERRNASGIEAHKSYEKMLEARFKDAFQMGAALLCVMVGSGFFLVGLLHK